MIEEALKVFVFVVAKFRTWFKVAIELEAVGDMYYLTLESFFKIFLGCTSNILLIVKNSESFSSIIMMGWHTERSR